MATQDEIAQQLNDANAELATANGIIAATRDLIVKVGTETDRLKDQIANLPLPGDASPALVAALDLLKTTVTATTDLVGQAKTAAGVVDDKVPDAP